jgi:hypothetical protein
MKFNGTCHGGVVKLRCADEASGVFEFQNRFQKGPLDNRAYPHAEVHNTLRAKHAEYFQLIDNTQDAWGACVNRMPVARPRYVDTLSG